MAWTEFGLDRMRRLCESCDAEACWPEMLDLFSRLTAGWGRQGIGTRAAYPSSIADDGAPLEFSVAFCGGSSEVQFYVEVLGDSPSLVANGRAGLSLLDELARERGLPLERIRLVEDLFFPAAPSGLFTLWIGATCTPGRSAQLKVYVNPQVQGPDAAGRVVDTAMARLGFASQWAKVSSMLAAGSQRRDEVGIVSFDLSASSDARIKVYIRHHGAEVRDLDQFGATAADYCETDAETFYTALAETSGPFAHKPPITELTFADRSAEGPSSVTLEFPIGSYVATDEIAMRRVSACMSQFGLSSERYEKAIRAFATRPLNERGGIHAHVTLRRLAKQPRIAVYLATEAYVRSGDVDGEG